jgi:hypothetical protein
MELRNLTATFRVLSRISWFQSPTLRLHRSKPRIHTNLNSSGLHGIKKSHCNFSRPFAYFVVPITDIALAPFKTTNHTNSHESGFFNSDFHQKPLRDYSCKFVKFVDPITDIAPSPFKTTNHTNSHESGFFNSDFHQKPLCDYSCKFVKFVDPITDIAPSPFKTTNSHESELFWPAWN